MAIAALIISIISLFGSGYALVLKKQSSDREKRREEYESKTSLFVSCEYHRHNNRDAEKEKPFQIGSYLRFSLAIFNYGAKPAFIKQIFLMGIDPTAVHKLHEFSLNNTVERNISPENAVNIELAFTKEKIKSIVAPSLSKTILIRVITENGSFFDSYPTQIEF